MDELLLYIGKSGLWIALFWIIWRLFLQNETFFRFNRFYLLAGLAFSLIAPFIKYTYTVVIPGSLPTETVLSGESTMPVQTAGIPLPQILLIIYVAGSFLAFASLLIALLRIGFLLRKNRRTEEAGVHIVHIEKPQSAFSFYNYIFLKEYPGMSERERELVIAHEKAHIDQKHWLDNLFAGLLLVVQWWNPFMYLYHKTIKENHEYLADQAVLAENETSTVIYKAVLINESLQTSIFSFTNSFHSNQLKRIDMMKKTKCNSIRKAGTLLLLPALALFIWACSEAEYKAEQQDDSQKKETLTLRNANEEAPLIIFDGEERSDIQLETMSTDGIESVSVLKDSASTHIYGEKGKNGVVIIESKEYAKKAKTE